VLGRTGHGLLLTDRGSGQRDARWCSRSRLRSPRASLRRLREHHPRAHRTQLTSAENLDAGQDNKHGNVTFVLRWINGKGYRVAWDPITGNIPTYIRFNRFNPDPARFVEMKHLRRP
jgi:hypothetical protein